MADGVAEEDRERLLPPVGAPPGAQTLVTVADVRAAEERIREFVPHSSLVPFGEGIFLKLENLQPTGSFKIRGALSKLSLANGRDGSARRRRVVAYSSGNHARAVARAARMLGLHATIVMPENAPQNKIQAVEDDGATIAYQGTASEERRTAAEELAREEGAVLVPPYDDPLVIAGQGTIGLELVEQLPDLNRVFVPIGGGGLASGIAVAIKALRPSAIIIGVEPATAADAQESLRSGRIVHLERDGQPVTIADGLRTEAIGQLPFHHLTALLDQIVTVSDDEIVDAMARLAAEARVVAEPSGAVALAACLRSEPSGGASAVIVSGGNVDIPYYLDLLRVDIAHKAQAG